MDQPTARTGSSGRPIRRATAATALALAMLSALPLAALAADPTPAPSREVRPVATVAPSGAGPVRTSATLSTSSSTARTGPAATIAPASLPPAPTKVLIYRESAMVKQYTNYWCVPATTQSAVNLIRGTSDRSKATQERYYKGTRANNRYTYPTKGNDPQGWAWAMTTYSEGLAEYDDRSFTDKNAALAAIVDSIDRTGEPVGALVHRGTHAWLVLGYKAQLDPAAPWSAERRKILGFYVSGPLGSPSDPWPYEYMPMAEFRDHFSRYHEWQFDVIWEDRWVIVAQ